MGTTNIKTNRYAQHKTKNRGNNPIKPSSESNIYVKLSVNIRHRLPEVTATDLVVFIALATHIDCDGICFPSLRTLERETYYKRSTILRSIKRLEEANWISVERGYRQGGWRDVNRYRLDNRLVDFGH